MERIERTLRQKCDRVNELTRESAELKDQLMALLTEYNRELVAGGKPPVLIAAATQTPNPTPQAASAATSAPVLQQPVPHPAPVESPGGEVLASDTEHESGGEHDEDSNGYEDYPYGSPFSVSSSI